MHGREGLENGLTGMSFDSHPISVFGQNRGDETHAERALHESSVGSALGIEGLPMTTRLCEWSGNSLTELTVSEYDMTILTIRERHVFCDDRSARSISANSDHSPMFCCPMCRPNGR